MSYITISDLPLNVIFFKSSIIEAVSMESKWNCVNVGKNLCPGTRHKGKKNIEDGGGKSKR